MEVKSRGRAFVGNFRKGDDLLEALTRHCEGNKVKLGIFSLVGSVTKAVVGYYNQDTKKYLDPIVFHRKLEIINCKGNISLKDGKIIVHSHITLSDEKGQCFGGHLLPGTMLFAAEYYLKELEGPDFNRVFDPETGLNLWEIYN